MHTNALRWVRRLVMPLMLLATLAVPTAASAQLYTGTPVPGVEITNPGPSTDVLGASGSRGVLGTSGSRAGTPAASASLATEVLGVRGQRSGGLAFTGADLGGLVVIGLGALTVGLVLTRRGRRVTG